MKVENNKAKENSNNFKAIQTKNIFVMENTNNGKLYFNNLLLLNSKSIGNFVVLLRYDHTNRTTWLTNLYKMTRKALNSLEPKSKNLKFVDVNCLGRL